MPPKKAAWTPTTPELRESGFLRLRNGIWQHIKEGLLTSNDVSVYLTIHKFADWKTGICHSNADSLSEAWGDFSTAKNKHDQFKNAMQRLRIQGYIDYPVGNGTHKNYNILINKADVTLGQLRGWRLRLTAGKPGHSDFSNPWYEYVSPTSFYDAYGFDWPVDTPEVPPEGFPEDTPDGLPDVRLEVIPVGSLKVLPLQDILYMFKTGKTGKKVSKTLSSYQLSGESVEPTNNQNPKDFPVFDMSKSGCTICKKPAKECCCNLSCPECDFGTTGLDTLAQHLWEVHERMWLRLINGEWVTYTKEKDWLDVDDDDLA
ncbi:MAG: hypothetical protein WCA21_06855 [Terracidiphilus sp.]